MDADRSEVYSAELAAFDGTDELGLLLVATRELVERGMDVRGVDPQTVHEVDHLARSRDLGAEGAVGLVDALDEAPIGVE